jgi:hypothetical protein
MKQLRVAILLIALYAISECVGQLTTGEPWPPHHRPDC